VLANVRGIAMTKFTSVDVVRHPLVARIVEAYDAQSERDALLLPRPPPENNRRTNSPNPRMPKLALTLQFSRRQSVS